MAYSNQLRGNPKAFSEDIEIRSGTSSTAVTIAAEYVTLGYEPGVGTMYMSSSGILFLHDSAGITDDNWSQITDTSAFTQTQSATMTLAASLATAVIGKQLGASITPSASFITSLVKTAQEAAITLSGTTAASIGTEKAGSMTLGGALTSDLTNVHEIFNVSIALSGEKSVSLEKTAQAGTLTLGPDFSYSHNPA